MKRPNEPLRDYAASKGVLLQEAGCEMGISEATLFRWLRIEFSEERRTAFIRAVDAVAERKWGSLSKGGDQNA